jgi:hypothetical protein
MISMRDYDPELIAALAEGILDPQEAAALEREIAGDPTAFAELTLQRRALRAIADAERPVLSHSESLALRAAVSAAVNLEPGTVSPAAGRRRLRWMPVAATAVALAAVIAVVPLLNVLSIGRGVETDMTVAAASTSADQVESYAATGPADSARSLGVEPGVAGESATVAPAAAKALSSLVSDPTALLASADPQLTLCAVEAAANFPAGAVPRAALVPVAAAQAVAWFDSADGVTIDRLVLLDPVTCLVVVQYP